MRARGATEAGGLIAIREQRLKYPLGPLVEVHRVRASRAHRHPDPTRDQWPQMAVGRAEQAGLMEPRSHWSGPIQSPFISVCALGGAIGWRTLPQHFER